MNRSRYTEVDTIRASALIGICVVNVPFMALPVEAAFMVQDQMLDKMSAFLVEGLFQMKFFLLFSFVFGWGFGTLQASVQRAERNFKIFYFRRLGALALIGLAHAILVFSGDILVLYAVLGAVLWLIKDFSLDKLRRFAVLMVPASAICLSVLAIVIDDLLTNYMAEMQGQTYHLAGGFFEASLGRWNEWPTTFLFLMFLQGPLAMGAFILGLVAYKTNFFQAESNGYRWLQSKLTWLVALAIPTNALYAGTLSGLLATNAEWLHFIGFIGIAIGAPALAAIYLYLLISLARRFQIPQMVLLAGRNSLSVYVVQGMLCGVVFGSYGFGLFNQIGLFSLIISSLIIGFLSMLLVSVYAARFGHGPLEPLLRKLSGAK